MDQEARTRDTKTRFWGVDPEERDWSESTQTYYFSKFQLFEHTEEINQFYRYSVFLEKVSSDLGEEWRQEANILFYPHFNSQEVFMQLLAIWLQFHPTLNNLQQNPFAKNNTTVFNQSFAEEFINRIQNLYRDRFPTSEPLKINSTSIRAICMGFFLTANQTWQQMFHKEEKVERKGFSLFSGVTQKINQSFEPLMVVTQKICNLFGRKKVKRNQPTPSTLPINNQAEKMFGDCYMEFRRTIDLEKQLQRKMSDVCLEEEEQIAKKKQKEKEKDKKMIVTKNEFKYEEFPVQKNMLGNMYDYISKFLKKKHPWQVASSFVTNILDINHQKGMQEGTRIKVLRPAQDFYQKLIITWLMFQKQNKKSDANFEVFLNQVKIAFGVCWREKYSVPTKYFYEKINKYWGQIKEQSMQENQKEIMGHLITRIRDSMRQDWERKIKIQGKQKN